MMQIMKRGMMILLCVAMLLTSAACGRNSSSRDIDISAYMEAFEAMDWETMWTLVSPDSNVDEDTFLEKHEAIFTGLGVNEVQITDLEGPDANGVYTYNATYKTDDYGEFTNAFTLTVRESVGRSGGVMWDYSLIFPELEEGGSVRIRTLKANRGEMFAADGTLMAANGFADTVYINTEKVQDIAAVAAAAAPVTGLSVSQITEKYEKAKEKETPIVKLGEFLPGVLTDAQKQSLLAVDGLGIDNKTYTPIREYPLGESVAHMVGYMGYPQDAEGNAAEEKSGVVGLELAYDAQLKGKDGKIVYIEDRWGRNIRTLWEQEMEEGQDLRLTIKPELQQTAFEALSTHLDSANGQSGVAIVMDAKTGFVEAMAMYPSFDSNLFTFGMSKETWDTLNAPESNRPLFSRATQGQYPPGSVIKPFTAVAALEAGAVTPETAFDGEIEDNKWTPTVPGWDGRYIRRVDDSGTPLQLYNGLVKSDNIYFAYIALKLGADSFIQSMERLGMEGSVPFDLPVKEAQVMNTGENMTLSRLADSGFGQGQLLVTPLQLAAMYTAFANGTGDMMRPVLVEKLCRTEKLDYVTVSKTEPAAWIENGIKRSTIDIITPIMQGVVEDGTGKAARVRGVKIAGKTGTAELGDDKSREISWFAGYWLEGHYDRLVVVMVDVAAEEGPVKFEIAKALLKP